MNVTFKRHSEAESSSETVSLTERAAGKLKEIMAREEKEDHALRLRVVGGGCAGYSYQMELDDAVHEEDLVVESHGVRLLVDRRSLHFLHNSEVDYVESLMESGFKIQNPNAKGGCSCGESFYA